MVQFVDTKRRTFTSAATLVAHERVDIDANGELIEADADIRDVGTVDQGCVAGDVVSVTLNGGPGTQLCIASAAITVGDPVENTTSGKVKTGASLALELRGIALTAAAADGDIIEVAPLGTNSIA